MIYRVCCSYGLAARRLLGSFERELAGCGVDADFVERGRGGGIVDDSACSDPSRRIGTVGSHWASGSVQHNDGIDSGNLRYFWVRKLEGAGRIFRYRL